MPIWVLEGRYDAFFDIKSSLKAVTAEDGPTTNMRINSALGSHIKGIPTYPLIHRDEKGEKFKEYESNQRVEGRWHAFLLSYSQQYFKEDVFSYVDKD